jgi:hypothetical protein
MLSNGEWQVFVRELEAVASGSQGIFRFGDISRIACNC